MSNIREMTRRRMGSLRAPYFIGERPKRGARGIGHAFQRTIFTSLTEDLIRMVFWRMNVLRPVSKFTSKYHRKIDQARNEIGYKLYMYRQINSMGGFAHMIHFIGDSVGGAGARARTVMSSLEVYGAIFDFYFSYARKTSPQENIDELMNRLKFKKLPPEI